MDRLPADCKRIDGIAKGAAKNSHQTRYRSHRIDRRPVGLHEQRIRIDGQQCWHRKHVSRRFQNPTAGRPPKLQMLKKPAMIFICRPKILLKKPSSIRRHIVHRIELITHECGSHKTDALLRNFCTHCMHVPERRGEPIEEVTTLGRALNSAFLIDESRWRWRPHFPHEWRAMLRVRSEQTMQQGGTAARQPDDKARFEEFLLCDVGIKLPVALYLQARA